MYNLAPYNPRSDKSSTAGLFFSRTDSTQAVYNYFRSVNEALLFLGENGWKLVSLNNNIHSESGARQRLLDTELPYTKINAKPVFYFKKPVDN